MIMRSFAVLLMLFHTSVMAGIAVEPAYISLDFNKGRASGRFIITNTGDAEERYRVVASHFTFSEEGALSLSDPDRHSMAEWIKFNPKEFTLPPKSKRVVRYVVLPRGKLKDGQYWAAMELESLEGRNYSTNDGGGRTFNLKVVPSVLAPMYGASGSIERDYDLTKFELSTSDRNKKVLEMQAVNTGNAVINLVGNYEIRNQSGEVVFESTLDSGLLLRDKTRTFVSFIEPDLPAGDYKLVVFYRGSSMEKVLERELDLKIE